MTRKTSKRRVRRPPGEQDSSTDGKDADWGFEPGEEEKVLEPRLGLALVICLALMFGFVLYQKYQSIDSASSDSLASKEAGNESDQLDPEDSSSVNDTPSGAADDGGSFELFAQSEPVSSQTFDPSTQQTNGGFAEASQQEQSDDFNPFGTEEETSSTEASQIVSAPPQQFEPSPFGEPDVSLSPDEVSGSRTPVLAASEADFGSEPPPTLDEPSGPWSLEPAPIEEAESPSASPPPSQGWGFVNEPQIADADQSSADPFAIHDDSMSTEGSHHVAEEGFPGPDGQKDFAEEPHPLESAEIAMPLPQQQEPNPFADPDPFAGDEVAGGNAPPHAQPDDWDVDPFADVADAEEPMPEQGLTASEQGFADATWQSPNEPNPNNAVADTSPILEAPQLPGLPAPSEQQHLSATETGWDLESASIEPKPMPSLKQPDFEFSPAPVDHDVSTEFQTAATEPHIFGERQVTVARNDSLWSISQKAYGTARYVPALARYNQDHVPSPDKVRVGAQIRIPPPEVLEARFPELFRSTGRRDALVAPAGGESSPSHSGAQAGLYLDSTGRPVYRVGKKDTLSRISRTYLGRASRWTEILALNGDQLKSPETLKPGMVLRMPADAGRVGVVPTSPFDR